MIITLMTISTFFCFLGGFYLLRTANDLYQAGDNNGLFLSFGFIAFAYGIMKNSMMPSEYMEFSAIVLWELFRIFVPLMLMVMSIKTSKYIELSGKKNLYHGIDRRKHGA